MRTDLGELRVLDAHAHFFSFRFFQTLVDALRDQLPAQDRYASLGKRLGWELPSVDAAKLGERWVAEMDRWGIGQMVLMASIPGDEEAVAAAAKAHPTRLIPYAMFDPTKPDPEGRVRRLLLQRGIRGVCLFPAMHHFHAWDERCLAVYREAEAAQAVVFVHVGHLRVGVRDLLGLPSPFDLRFANPLDLVRPAKDFPKLPFVIPHFGCGFFREALMLGDLCPNVSMDTSSSNAWMKLMPYPLDLRAVFDKALQVYTPRRILFGTDSSFFPRGWRKEIFDQQWQALRELKLPQDLLDLIFGGNLARLLGPG
jgi:predicted TIM-barrel fold metal-dependent hydrolase